MSSPCPLFGLKEHVPLRTGFVFSRSTGGEEAVKGGGGGGAGFNYPTTGSGLHSGLLSTQLQWERDRERAGTRAETQRETLSLSVNTPLNNPFLMKPLLTLCTSPHTYCTDLTPLWLAACNSTTKPKSNHSYNQHRHTQSNRKHARGPRPVGVNPPPPAASPCCISIDSEPLPSPLLTSL